jgi:small subunit ribosomal protein S20
LQNRAAFVYLHSQKFFPKGSFREQYLNKQYNSKMANHKSSLKRIRNSESKRVRNRYQAKTMRNAIRDFLEVTDKKAASTQLPKLASMLDRLAKKSVIHKNKASNLKSELASHINHLK